MNKQLSEAMHLPLSPFLQRHRKCQRQRALADIVYWLKTFAFAALLLVGFVTALLLIFAVFAGCAKADEPDVFTLAEGISPLVHDDQLDYRFWLNGGSAWCQYPCGARRIIPPCECDYCNVEQEDVMEITQINDKHRWIKIQNPEGVSSSNAYHTFGDIASTQMGDELKVIAESEERALVQIINKATTGGACAPNGTMFFIDKQEFYTMTRNYETEMARQAAEKAKVKYLLRNAKVSQ